MLIAGWNGLNPTNGNTDSVEIFNSHLNIWKPGVKLPMIVRATIVQSFDDKTVIVSGGYDGYNAMQETYQLTTTSSAWNKLTDLPFRWCSQVSGVLTLPNLGLGILALGSISQDLSMKKSHFGGYAWFLAKDNLTWIQLKEFEVPPGIALNEGQIYQYGDKIIAIPFQERKEPSMHLFKSKKILTKDLTNLETPWNVREMDSNLDKESQFVLNIKEHTVA